MRKIFMDVGGFQGELSRAALDPLFGFEVVYCFEPVVACCEQIAKAITNKRFHLLQVDLLDKTTVSTVYSVGSLGASVYADAEGNSENAKTAD